MKHFASSATSLLAWVAVACATAKQQASPPSPGADAAARLADAAAPADADVQDVVALIRRYVNATRVRTERCRPGPVEPAFYMSLEQDLARSFSAPGVTSQAQMQFALCVADLEKAGCGAEPESCAGNIAGALAGDAPCLLDAQCQSGRCLGAQVQSCGACGAARTLGSECTDGTACGPELECAPISKDIRSAQCFVRQVSGIGASCTEGRVCSVGLRCNQSLTQPVCEGLVPPGSSCASAKSCDEAGTSYCDTSLTCVKRPVAGDSCSSVTCASGLLCDRTTKQCRAARLMLAVDAACEQGDTCAAGLGCSRVVRGSTAPRRCLALASLGADCTLAHCADELVCDGLQSSAPRCVAARLASDCQ